MGFLDRLLGREEPQPQYTPAPRQAAQAAPQRSDDEIAVERYRYLLRTAPPETIEQVHEEAFSKLTPEQRQLLFQELSANAPAGEQPRGDDARSLAQSATRSELRQPGTLERSFNGNGGNRQGGGMGFGAMVGSSLLGTVAGYVIGSAIVSAFLPSPGAEASADGTDASSDGGTDAGSDSGDTGTDAGGDVSADGGDWSGGSGDFGGGDFGGDFGGGFDF